MVSEGGAHGLRLYVLRHGEPERRDLFYGHHDLGLSPRGLAQARAQAERLGRVPLVAIYTSDLERARVGASLVAEQTGAPIHVDPALREMSLGALEGVPHAEALERYPEWATRSYMDMLDTRMPGGGESVRDLSERVLTCTERLVRAHAGPAERDRWPVALIYAHNTVARVLLAQAAGAGPAGYTRFMQRYGAINRLELPLDAGNRDQAPAIRWERASIGYCNRDPLAYTADER